MYQIKASCDEPSWVSAIPKMIKDLFESGLVDADRSPCSLKGGKTLILVPRNPSWEMGGYHGDETVARVASTLI